MKSRREFLRLMAVGSAAAVTGQARRVAAAAAKSAPKTTAPKAEAPRTAAVRTEIDKQKKSTADALKTIRKYELPAGSPLAFTFKPLRPARRGGH